MPEDDSARSTDLVDVLRGALAAPWLRGLAVWLVSAAGTAASLLIPVILWDIYDTNWDRFWLSIVGVPLTFIGSVVAGVDGSYLWVRSEEFARFRSHLEPWEYSALRVLTLRFLLVPAVLLWLRSAWRHCAGRHQSPACAISSQLVFWWLRAGSRIGGGSAWVGPPR